VKQAVGLHVKQAVCLNEQLVHVLFYKKYPAKQLLQVIGSHDVQFLKRDLHSQHEPFYVKYPT